MGNTASNYEAKKKLKYNRSRMNSMNSLDTVTSKYSINNLVNRLKQSSSSRKSSNRSSIKSNTTNPLVGYTSQVDAHSQATLIADEMKNFHSSELVLKELFQAPETSPEKRRDRDRRHRQHYLSKRTWDGNHKVILNDPTMIVHWCCATAVWDIELAFEFPNAKVVGIDYETVTVSSLTNTVKNFSFLTANIHEGDNGLQHFQDNQVDYIMMRDVWLFNTHSSKWKILFKEIHRVLKPGGCIEIYEQNPISSSKGPYLTQLEDWASEFYKVIQYDPQTLLELSEYLNDAGFHHIYQETKDLPIGEWGDTLELKETGYLQRDLVERRFREIKPWLCLYNPISEKEFSNALVEGMEECDEFKTSVQHLYYCGQK